MANLGATSLTTGNEDTQEANMTASGHGTSKQVACKCLNIRVSYQENEPSATSSHDSGVRPADLVEGGTNVALPLVVGRDLINVPEITSAFAVPALRCLNCSTCVYAVEKAASSGPTRSVGFKSNTPSGSTASPQPSTATITTTNANSRSTTESPNRQKTASSRDLSALKPADGVIYILPGCLDEIAIQEQEKSPAFSSIYGVVILDNQRSRSSASNGSAPSADEDATSDSLQGTSSSDSQPIARPNQQQRHSSYGTLASVSQYGLQGLPGHLITLSTDSSQTRSPRSSMIGSQSLLSSANHPSAAPNLQHNSSASPALAAVQTTSGLSEISSSSHPIAVQLDATALERLRLWRAAEEQKIQDIIRAKRRALDVLIQKTKEEATAIFERAKNAPPPHSSLALRNTSALTRTDSSDSQYSALPPPRTQESAAQTEQTPVRASLRESLPADSASPKPSEPSSFEEHHSLSSDAFRRIPPRGSVSTTTGNGYSTEGLNHNNVSSSLSALSASFALRGRDGPTQMDDWAQKRRLKARYPEGDHSVMTSAATSAANSFSEPPSEADNDEQEEESRGRGRQRGERTEQDSQRSAEAAGRSGAAIVGTTSVPPGTVARPSMAPSSLTAAPVKGRASTSLDLGKEHDQGTPKSGGVLGGLASPSAQVNLRPRNPPPSSAEPLKPATRKAKKEASDGSGAMTSNTSQRKGKTEGAALEKKVAFAETTDEAIAGPQDDYGDSDDDEEEKGKQLVDERGTGVFDIDEDIDDDEEEEAGGSPRDDDDGTSNDVTGEDLVGAAGQLSIGDDAAETVDAFDDTVTPTRGRSFVKERQASDDGDEELGGVRASVGAQYAGSFSALAASLQRDGGWARRGSKDVQDQPGFDPASLRLDGRVAHPGSSLQNTLLSSSHSVTAGSLQPRSSSRNRGGSAARDLSGPVSSDYDDAAADDVRDHSHGGWNRRGTSIGYRTTIGDTELHLSGLLAPHAPSHRRLWRSDKKKKNDKYLLEEIEDEDVTREPGAKTSDSQWSAWQKRAQEMESKRIAKDAAEEKTSHLAQSVPANRDPVLSSSWMAGRSSQASRAIAMGKHKNTSTTTVYEGNSGFDREPKTSLPYQERKMVPSLLKATRRGVSDLHKKSTLATIPDADTEENSVQDHNSIKTTTTGGGPAGLAARGDEKAPSEALLSGSQVQRGFAVPEVVSSSATVQLPTEAALGVPGVSSPALSPGHLTPGSATSGRSSTSSGRRRSDRAPYEAPPPPTSSGLRLTPDPQQKPSSLSLFGEGPNKTPADTRFAYNEEGEEEETDWSKVLHFMHRVECLKKNKRTGWLHHRVQSAESIADHMYRMAILAMLCPNDVDIGKCVMLALVHDLAEAEVGDLTPLDGVPKEEKTRREAAALEYLVHDLLGASPAALRLEALWHEYEDRKTLESKLVKDLDRFELLLQAVEYEREHDIVDLQPFFTCSRDMTHPRIRKWTVELAKEREEMWGGKFNRKFAYVQTVPSDEEVRGVPL
ncbi:unnamed protein product [Sympodiomycopsis kandeliae]